MKSLFSSFLVFYALSLAAWLTHIVVCIKAGMWLLLITGAIMFPIGIIHGFGVWVGVW